VAALMAAHATFAPRLEPDVILTLGLPTVSFLPPATLIALVAGGAALGGLGGLLARRRGQA
jgi:hypothetical protein